MTPKPVLHQLPLAAALSGSEPLQGLLQRLRQSQARLDAITPLLPPALRQAVQSGTLDDARWTLLAANSAAAAKLRQILPQLQAELLRLGWPEVEIRLRVLGSRAGQ